MITDRYDLETYLRSFFIGDTVCNESLMFVENADGTLEDAPLLYRASEILAVRSFDLGTLYTEGVDYVLRDGRLFLPASSRIFRWASDAYYPPEKKEGACFGHTGGGFIVFGEGDTFFRTQVAVSYRHADGTSVRLPAFAGAQLPKTIGKLQRGEPTSIVYFGDSITTGANSSRTQAPFAPMWSEMTTAMLQKRCNHPHIRQVNTAVGGTDSAWGLRELQARVTPYAPDLVVLAFGMNDGCPAEEFAENTRAMLREIRKECPATEFILVSTSQPNPAVEGFYRQQYLHEALLADIVAQTEGCVLAPLWSLHGALLEKKRFYDMTGNNVNHPNDFLARLYAQTMCALLLDGANQYNRQEM